MRPLRFAKLVSDTSVSASRLPSLPAGNQQEDVPEGATPFIIAVARRYQNQGLSLADLIDAGEAGWQRAQRYYATVEPLYRWGSWWVQESILMALHELLPDEQAV